MDEHLDPNELQIVEHDRERDDPGENEGVVEDLLVGAERDVDVGNERDKRHRNRDRDNNSEGRHIVSGYKDKA